VRAAPAQLLQMAFFGIHHPLHPHAFDIGEMWVASSVIDDYFIHPILFFSEIKDFQELSWRHLGLTDLRLSHADYYVLYYRTGTELTMKVMAKDDVIAVPPMEENEVLLSYLSPVWQLSDKVDVALLGEMDKFVPISPERIKALDFHEPGVAHLRVQGSSGEHVSMKFAMVMTGSRIIIEVVDCECIVRQDSTGHLRLHVIGDDGDKIACSLGKGQGKETKRA